MKILILSLNFAPEPIGTGYYSGDMAKELAARGHAIHAVSGKPFYPAWRIFDDYASHGWKHSVEHGIAVTRCPIYIPAKPSGGKRILHYLSFGASGFLPALRIALRERPDIAFVAAPTIAAAPMALTIGRMTGATTWLHIQDFEVEAALATGLIARDGWLGRTALAVERMILPRFDIVSTISPQMRAKLVDKGVAPERIYEFRNWADVDAVRPISGPSSYRDEWGIRTPHVALYSGNIANKQGIEIVLEAAIRLRDRRDLTFVVCGQGPNRANLEQAAADLDNIQFRDLQPRERLGELLGLATIHLLPQLADAADLVLPSKLTNMLASGRPIVATALAGTGLGDEVQGCGVLTPPGDAAQFAEAIARLMDDPERCAEFGAAARARAEERWAKDMVISRFVARAEGAISRAD